MRASILLIAWAVLVSLLLGVAVAAPAWWADIASTLPQALLALRPASAQAPEQPARLEWLGWQFFRVTSLTGKVLLFNPFLNDPMAAFANRDSPITLGDLEKADLIMVTSGHGDDQGQAVEIARKTGATIVTTFELASWMVAKGVASDKIMRVQPGSRLDFQGIRVQVVNAVHGSGATPPPGPPGVAVYGGPALGFIVTLESGLKIYHAGSTALTMDLQLYGQRYQPHVALLPIASGLMPDEAALAAEFLMKDNPNLHSVFPQHHASFFPPAVGADVFVKEVRGRRTLTGRVRAFNPRPGQVFFVTTRATRTTTF